jgi:hypothetical protein
MTEEEVLKIAEEALPETSAKGAEISFIVNDSSTWVIVLDSQGEELAVRVAETPESTSEYFRRKFIYEVSKLF